MISTLKFKDFYVEENYLKLINDFAMLDERYEHLEPPCRKVFKGDFSVIRKEVDLVSQEEKYVEEFFHKDYLVPKINDIPRRYITFLLNELKNPVYLDSAKVKQKAEEQMNYFIDVIQKLDQEYLEEGIVSMLKEKAEEIIQWLKETHIYPNNDTAGKIKFNMNKDTLLVFMLLLKKKGLIECAYNHDLGALIDANFVYFNKREKKFKPIVGSSKVLNDIENDNKSVKRSVARVAKYFDEDNVYDPISK